MGNGPERPLLLLALVVGLPMVVLVAKLVLITPRPQRSLFSQVQGDTSNRWIDFGMLALLVVALLTAGLNQQSIIAAATGAYAVIAARLLTSRLISAKQRNEREYMLGTDWDSLDNKGPHWRYEMKHRFVMHPEYIDELLLALVSSHETFASFEHAIRHEEFPERLEAIADQKAWGLGMPSTRQLASTLPDYLFRGCGPRSSRATAEQVYAELRSLLHEPPAQRMDRLQYHWRLSGLDTSDVKIARDFGWRREFVYVGVGVVAWLVVQAVSLHTITAAMFLSAIAGASVFWLAYVGGGVGVFFLRQFTGTGTYSIDNPLEDRRYDRVWNEFLSLGVFAFLLMFIGCAVGLPLVLFPSTPIQGISLPFVIASLFGLAYCLLVFLNHTFVTHALMFEGRANAIARLRERLGEPLEVEERQKLMTHFNEVRDLRVWPLDGAMLSKVAIGIVVPVIVQVIILRLNLA